MSREAGDLHEGSNRAPATAGLVARSSVEFTLVCTSCCAGWPTDVDHGICKRCGGDLELRGIVHFYDLKGE